MSTNDESNWPQGAETAQSTIAKQQIVHVRKQSKGTKDNEAGSMKSLLSSASHYARRRRQYEAWKAAHGMNGQSARHNRNDIIENRYHR